MDEDTNMDEVIDRYVERKDIPGLLGMIAHSLFRIADSQERVVDIAEADINAAIEQAVEEAAEKKAASIVEEKTRRSFIGKR